MLRGGDLLAAALLGAGVAVVLAAIVLMAAGSGSGGEHPVTTASPPAALFSPSTADEQAVAELARRTVEALPQGRWPALYDEFTPEFQTRCPRDEFVAVGERDAAAQGSNLALIRYKGLRSASVTDTSAEVVIVGTAAGGSEYTIRAYFQKVDGVWRIAPAPGTEGCAAFSRLSG